MNELQTMMATHPRSDTFGQETAAHVGLCAQICVSCADACLAEPMVEHLRRCIRLNLDCADICNATARVLTRQTETNSSVVQALLRACAAACRQCMEECARHADMHEHCRICAEHCRACAEMCEGLIRA